MRSQGSDRHLVEVDLIRYLDEEGNAEERRRWHIHLAACEPCREAATSLQAEGAAISWWLAAADFENAASMTGRVPAAALDSGTTADRPRLTVADGRPPSMRNGHRRTRRPAVAGAPWLKAAAITLLLAAPLAAMPGVRGWVAERAGLQRSDAPAPSATTAAAPDAIGTAPAVIRFVPAPGSFAVVLESMPAGGALEVGRVTGTEVIFEIQDGQPGSSPLVGARGIRIGDNAGASTSYRLSVPPQVDAVVIEVGGREIRLDGRALQRPSSIELGGGGGS